MNKVDLKKLMENVFIEDFMLNEKYSYISQIGVISIKSLIPLIDDLGVRIDYKRFSKELQLWKSYRVGENPTLLNLEKLDSDIYWTQQDDSIFSRIVPIIIANQDWDVLKEEIIKNILYTTGSIRDMLEFLSIAYLVYLKIQKESEILVKLKEMIIAFAQVDFLDEYEEAYRLALETYPGNYRVDFEKEKIQIISLLNGISTPKYSKLEDLIAFINNEEVKTPIGRILSGLSYGEKNEFRLPGFYKNLGSYLENLRKGKINSAQLEIKEYTLPNIFSFSEGDVFFHSLLNDSKVIKKEVSNGKLTSLVQTKTGMYLFEKIDL